MAGNPVILKKNTRGLLPVTRLEYDAPFLAPDGLVTAPTYSFGNSATSGLYSPAVGEVAMAAAGVQRVRAHATGVDLVGTNLSIRGVVYTWPVANAGGVLTNDGAGTLTWEPASGSELVFMLMGA